MIENDFLCFLLIHNTSCFFEKNTLFSIHIHIYGKMFSRLWIRTICFFLFASAASSIYAICIVYVAHLNGVIVK